jgi:hypothetical protein
MGFVMFEFGIFGKIAEKSSQKFYGHNNLVEVRK